MEALITILIPLLIQVESSGNDLAKGDNGASRGCLQISRAYWTDGCQELGVDWDYDTDVWSRSKSIKITRAVLLRSARFYKRKTGRTATLEVLARCHNGSYYGWSKKYPKKYANTTKYWLKIRKELEKKAKK